MAVYTHITREELTEHLGWFDIGRLVSFEGITEGVENTNYRVVTTGGVFVLTLLEKRVRKEDLPFIINFMERIRNKNIPCPRVIASTSDKKFLSLAGKTALITNFLEGRPIGEKEAFHITAVGQTLAQMHLAGEKFKLQRDNPMSLPAWRALIGQCNDQIGHAGGKLAVFLGHELEYLEKNWPQGLPAGAIHADLFPDNVFFKGEKLAGIIDFYFACTDVFVYDLMLTLNAWCFNDNGEANPHSVTEFLSAYKKIRPLNTEERKSLDFFGRAAAFRIIATRLYDRLHPVAGADVTPKDPLEYVRILGHYQKGSGAS